MLPQTSSRTAVASSPAAEPTARQDSRPAEVAELLAKVAALLESGHARKALELLQRWKVKSPWVTNAMAVCMMRLEDAPRSVQLLKGLVITSGVCFRNDVPAVFLINFATALLLTNNISGSKDALGMVPDQHAPGVVRLRDAIRRWWTELSFWQKLRWYWGDTLDHPVQLDFPPGEI
jgi:hypothetical protein